MVAESLKKKIRSCLKSRARRLVFPSFEGEDVEVEIPLVLTAAL